MLREEVEVCSYCMGENILQWDVEKDGYKAKCQHCGEELMLCDACLHSDDNDGYLYCDWTEEGCWRQTVWIDVYKDTINKHDDDWNQSSIKVTEKFAKKYFRECKLNSDCEWKTYDEFMKEYTLDDTEDLYEYAKLNNAILEIEHVYANDLEKAKELINEYCQKEFNVSCVDFSNLENVGIAYTTLTDYEIQIQVSVDLINMKLKTWIAYDFADVTEPEKLKILRWMIWKIWILTI